MKADRIELEQKLDGILTIYNGDKHTAKEIREQLWSNHNIDPSESQSIWGKNVELGSISETVLYLFTKYLYQKTKEKSINPEKYFTDVQISEGDKYKKGILKEDINFPIVFKDCIRIKDNQYVTSLPITELPKILSSGAAYYNFETQRDPKLVLDDNGELIKKPNVKDSSVTAIKNLILDGQFTFTTITFNIRQDEEGNFAYNQKGHELAILSGSLDIIDGYHRCMGIIAALIENPYLDYNTEIRVTYLSTEEALRLIGQEYIRNTINKEYINSNMNLNKTNNKVISKLNEKSGAIGGKITYKSQVIKLDKAYTMFDILTKAFDDLWKIDNNNYEINKKVDYLSTFFDFIIGYKNKEFKNNLTESKKTNIIALPVTFAGYIALAHQLENDSDWEEKMKRFLDETDFDINLPIWKELKIVDINLQPIFKISKPDLKKIFKYFKERIN